MIMETINHGRYHLKCANYNILLQCNHNNLVSFQTSKVRSLNQACLAEISTPYAGVIMHFEEIGNPVNEPSGIPKNEIGYERLRLRLLAVSATATVDLNDDLLQAIRTA